MDASTYMAFVGVFAIPYALLMILLNRAWTSEEAMKRRFDFLWEAFSELQRERERVETAIYAKDK